MKTQWDLGPVTFDTTLLWNTDGGPSLKSIDRGKLKQADARLRQRFVSGEIGFYDLPSDTKSLDLILSTSEKLEQDFPAALVLGIGGSYLGAASLVQAVGTEKFPLTWVSNIDPHAIKTAAVALRNSKHAAIVISKSGNTTETLAAFYHFASGLDPRGIVAITDPKTGELRKLANANDWTSLEVPPNVGGRFSVLSPVGLLPACLGGVDIARLLAGAQGMRQRLDAYSADENPAYLFSSALHDWNQAGRTVQYLMPYWSNLRLFAEWYVQLWGESLGKKQANGTRVGPTAVAALGTTDQHSLLQLFNEGPLNKVVGFIDVAKQGPSLAVGKPPFAPGASSYLCNHSFEKITHEALLATRQSLTSSKVPTYTCSIPELNAEALGAFVFFLETATAFSGELYGINAFNQPGVEESKLLLHAALRD
jgi:glucose-6-phosphate isomerase